MTNINPPYRLSNHNTLAQLKTVAREVAGLHGHTLTQFNHRIAGTSYTVDRARAVCKNCGRTVEVWWYPPYPRETIAGDAYREDCTGEL